MLRIILALTCAVSAASVAVADDATTMFDHYVAAIQAREDGNEVDYHASMLAAHALEPGHAVLQMHLARAATGIGALEEAAGWALGAFEQGAWLDVRTDPWMEDLIASEFGARVLANADVVGAHRGRAEIGLEFEPHDLLVEGIAHDAQSGRFFLSSMRGRKIVAVTSEGSVTDFIGEAQEGFGAGLGLDVDVERRRLWAVDVADPRYAPFEEQERGRTGVWCWSLDDGSLLARFDAPRDSVRRGFNDVAVHPDGGAVITDSDGGTLYRVDAGLTSMDRVLDDGGLNGPNGLVVAADGRRVYVAEYVFGLRAVDLVTGEHARVGRPKGVSLIGIDGLALHEGSLIAVQNYAGLDRAVRFRLADDGLAVTGCEVLEARHPRMDDPTTGVVVDGAFWFIANSHVSSWDPEIGPASIEDWTKTLVLRVEL